MELYRQCPATTTACPVPTRRRSCLSMPSPVAEACRLGFSKLAWKENLQLSMTNSPSRRCGRIFCRRTRRSNSSGHAGCRESPLALESCCVHTRSLLFPVDVVQYGGSNPDLSTTQFHLYSVTIDCPGNQAIAY